MSLPFMNPPQADELLGGGWALQGHDAAVTAAAKLEIYFLIPESANTE